MSYADTGASIFVDGLPQRTTNSWLRAVFRSFRSIYDTFVPVKRRLRSTESYGFVRFHDLNEATRAVKSMNGRWVAGVKLRVQWATPVRSAIPTYTRGRPQLSTAQQDKTTYTTQDRGNDSTNRSGVHASSDLPRISVSNYNKRVEAWLKRSIIAQSIVEVSLDDVLTFITDNDLYGLSPKGLSNNAFILVCDSIDTMDAYLGPRKEILQRMFSEVYKYSGETLGSLNRRVWLEIHGMPVQCWSNECFADIAKLWGRFVRVDPRTSTMRCMDVARILVDTCHTTCIHQIVQVHHSGGTRLIFVKEGSSALLQDYSPSVVSRTASARLAREQAFSTSYPPQGNECTTVIRHSSQILPSPHLMPERFDISEESRTPALLLTNEGTEVAWQPSGHVSLH